MKILAPQISCLLEPSDFYEEDGKDALNRAYEAGYRQIYVTTEKGTMKYHFLTPGKGGKARYILLPQTVPGVSIPTLSPAVEFLPDGKIPMRLLDEVKAFFTEVIKQKGQNLEAMIWIVWNEERGYHLVVPNQTVGGASARYDWASLPAGCTIVVDIHSHANFGAFFSGTDDNDDVGGIRFSGVIGHNVKPPKERDMKFRFNYYGTRIETKVEDLFVEEVAEVEVPSEWIAKVETQTYTSHAYQGRHGYGPSDYDGSGFNSWHRSPTNPANFNRGPSQTQGMRQSNLDLPVGQRVSSGANNSNSGAGAQSEDPFRLDMLLKLSEDQFAAMIDDLPAKQKKQLRRQRAIALSIQAQRTKGQSSSKRKGNKATEGEGGPDLGNVVEGGAGEGVTGHFPGAGHGADGDDVSAYSALNGFENLPETELDEPLSIARGIYVSEQAAGEGEMDPTNLTPDYEVLCINRGVTAANAVLAVDAAILSLTETPDLFPRVVVDMFGAMAEEDKLKVLRRLAENLPEAAKEDLERNGL